MKKKSYITPTIQVTILPEFRILNLSLDTNSKDKGDPGLADAKTDLVDNVDFTDSENVEP